MKIILNTESLKPPLTGIGHYTTHLWKGLQQHALIEQIIGLPVDLGQFDQNNPNISPKKAASTFRKIARSLPFTYAIASFFKQRKFKKMAAPLAKQNFIYHETSYILNPYDGPKVCSIHDLSHIYYPQHHPRERVKFLQRMLPLSIEKADHIITGSHHSREDLIKQFTIAPDKITTVYHGVDAVFKPRDATEIEVVLGSYGLKNQAYLLSVATLEPRKNLVSLIEAHRQLPETLRNQYPLVLVGVKGWKASALEKTMRELINKQQLYCLGYVPTSHLPYLYAGARAFAYVSLYEGFGLPLLEALACGTPVLSSNTTSMPEVVGDAGLLVAPEDIIAMQNSLEPLLTDDSLRMELQQKALLQAAKFSWQKCVEDTIAVYKHVGCSQQSLLPQAGEGGA